MSTDDRGTVKSGPSIGAPTLRESPSSRDAAPATTPDGIAIGSVVANRYRVLARLGVGGMGAVYRARDRTLDTDIAIKLLVGDVAKDPGQLAWLRSEVRTARAVTHPNVCRIHDFEEGDNVSFITMEYVDGTTLAARLRERNLVTGEPTALDPLDAMLGILHGVASGLGAAHAAGIVHRDLKPSNVLLARDGRVLVADFGIAGEHRVLAAGPSEIAGTDGYMAPEQARGDAVDARADVYAFGVLATVALTGARPLPSGMRATMTGAGGSAAALPVESLEPALATLPASLASLIRRCMAEDPAQRPADGNAIASELAGVRGGVEPVATRPGTAPAPRRMRPWLLAAVAVIVGGLAVGIAIGRGRSADHATPPSGGSAVATRAPLGPNMVPAFVVQPSIATGLAVDTAWMAAAVDRALRDELTDAWGVDAVVGTDPAAADRVVVAAAVTRDPDGSLHWTSPDGTFSATTSHALAITVAAALVAKYVPAPLRRPTTADLAADGATDVEAWRLWRRAQRASLMVRWVEVSQLTTAALARSPGMPLALVEQAISFDAGDSGGTKIREQAIAAVEASTVGPHWRAVAELLRALGAGDQPAAAAAVAKFRALQIDPRTRMYVDIRLAMAQYETEAPTAAATLTQIAEQYPREAAPAKMLAMLYLDSDQPGADDLALRYAERASSLAADDPGARAMWGVALARVGRLDDAKARATELAQMSPEERRLARYRLFELHLALGDPTEAATDAQRLLAGTSQEDVAMGHFAQALMHLYWGQFAAATTSFEDSARVRDHLGMTKAGALTRLHAGIAAWQIGDLAQARTWFQTIADGSSQYAPAAATLVAILAGDSKRAHELLARVPENTTVRAIVETKLAVAEHRDEDVVAIVDRLAQASTTLDVRLDRAAAYSRLGRDAEARRELDRLVHDPIGYSQPVTVGLAYERLADLATLAGDSATAKVAAAAIQARWSRAERTTPTP